MRKNEVPNDEIVLGEFVGGDRNGFTYSINKNKVSCRRECNDLKKRSALFPFVEIAKVLFYFCCCCFCRW
jgi:hypothetical protein